MKTFIKSIITMTSVLALAACSESPKGWVIEGSVNAPDSTVLVIEAGNNGRWYAVDTVTIDNGSFRYESAEPAGYPDVMRLAFGEKYIYFPVDSIDVIHVQASGNDNYTLSGSATASTISALDSLIRVQTAAETSQDVVNNEAFKKQLFARAFADPSVLPGYYLLNRTVGTHKLYDPSRKSDLRMYGAVAQRFTNERPEDIRGKHITHQYLQGRALAAGAQPTQEIAVPQTGVIDIKRADRQGTSHSLADVASKGNVVLLSFTNYTAENSPAYNVILGDLYETNHDKGLEIYQIAFDADETLWRQTAAKLPWITVWNSTTDDFQPITSYNVDALPTTFIIDRQGTLRQRITDPTELAKEIKKYL